VGMSDLTNFALRNEIDLPYYLFHSAEELSLVIPTGRVLDDSMEAWLGLFDGFIARKTGGANLTPEQKVVLAYVIKSEQANRLGRYTIALTPDNNHFQVIAELERIGLLQTHPDSERFHRVYLAASELVETDVAAELRALLGSTYEQADPIYQATLQAVCLADRFSSSSGLNAKQITRLLKSRLTEEYQRRGEDEFYRAIRYRVERLAPDKSHLSKQEQSEWVAQPDHPLKMKGTSSRPIFSLNRNFQPPML
jgi:hypothetical protein